jgi:membrane protein
MRVPIAFRLLLTAAKAFRTDGVPRMGAALAYYTLFAMGPMLVVVIAVAGSVFGAEAARGEIVGQIDALIGRGGAQAVQNVLAQSGPENGSGFATILGLITLVLAATGAFLELQYDLNTIWRVKPKPKPRQNLLGSVGGFLLKRLRSFGLVVSIGFILMVSLAVSAGLNAVDGWLSRYLPAGELILAVINFVISIGVITLLFAAVYRILPDVQLQWSDVWIGAVITALLFTIGKEAIGAYLGESATASTFGAAGSVVVLMVWVYYSAQIVLFGAEFSRVYLRLRHSRLVPESFAERVAPPQRAKVSQSAG